MNENFIFNYEGMYNKKQLDALPKFPFLHDINSSKIKLKSYNPVTFIKRLYHKYVGGRSSSSSDAVTKTTDVTSATNPSTGTTTIS